tara:strand:+ start:11034 stop:11498 length:465 start_codon:yes stop_codon:yes gene_type:complete
MKSTLQKPTNMYDQYDFDVLGNAYGSMNNRLFCTFTQLDEIDNLVERVSSQYDVLYNKIFVLNIKSNDEYVVTYNVDQGNISSIPENTILVHRKKETNTLYTINALNTLIKSLNGGVVDNKFPIDWNHYRNCILLTQHNELKQLNTKIHDIVNL